MHSCPALRPLGGIRKSNGEPLTQTKAAFGNEGRFFCRNVATRECLMHSELPLALTGVFLSHNFAL